MGSMGLERTFAVVAGVVLVILGVAGSLGNPIVGGPEQTGVIVTGFGHDLVHLISGALFLHVGLALNGRNRAFGLVGLGRDERFFLELFRNLLQSHQAHVA